MADLWDTLRRVNRARAAEFAYQSGEHDRTLTRRQLRRT
jgi:hypothetical protein